MKHLVGIGVLVALAFVLRFWLRTSLALDISIHYTYWVVPLRAIVFWWLMGTAIIWFLIFASAAIRRHSGFPRPASAKLDPVNPTDVV